MISRSEFKKTCQHKYVYSEHVFLHCDTLTESSIDTKRKIE